MRDRAFLIREAVRNGITDINYIKEMYNDEGRRIKLGVPYRTFEAGSDYDYYNAAPENMPKSENDHWSSRNPHTGQILKAPNHPTYNLAVEGEEAAGYEIQKIGDREYSFPKDHKFSGEDDSQINSSFEVEHDMEQIGSSVLSPGLTRRDIKKKARRMITGKDPDNILSYNPDASARNSLLVENYAALLDKNRMKKYREDDQNVSFLERQKVKPTEGVSEWRFENTPQASTENRSAYFNDIWAPIYANAHNKDVRDVQINTGMYLQDIPIEVHSNEEVDARVGEDADGYYTPKSKKIVTRSYSRYNPKVVIHEQTHALHDALPAFAAISSKPYFPLTRTEKKLLSEAYPGGRVRYKDHIITEARAVNNEQRYGLYENYRATTDTPSLEGFKEYIRNLSPEALLRNAQLSSYYDEKDWIEDSSNSLVPDDYYAWVGAASSEKPAIKKLKPFNEICQSISRKLYKTKDYDNLSEEQRQEVYRNAHKYFLSKVSISQKRVKKVKKALLEIADNSTNSSDKNDTLV